jgi:hypothetical protein
LTCTNLAQGHTRLTAYAAKLMDNEGLARRAWSEFFQSPGGVEGSRPRRVPKRVKVAGTDVLRPVEEAPFVSTNGSAQWGLAALQCLALIGESTPES